MDLTKKVEKALDFKVKELSQDEEFFYFEGYASTFNNVDYDGDIMDRNAFDSSIRAVSSGKQVVKVLWGHHMSEPIGIITDLKVDEYGLYVKGKMPKDDDFVSKRVMPQVRIKSVDSMSVGFRVLGYEIEKGVDAYGKQEATLYRITDLMLFEISLVPLPANKRARITAAKSVGRFKDLPLAESSTEWAPADAAKRVKSIGPDALDGFLWRSVTDDLSLDGCKLLIADVIDDVLTIVPDAVLSAAKAIKSGDHGIPEEDIPGVQLHIEKYCQKMGVDSPFAIKKLSIEELKDSSERDLETSLRNGVCFSQSAAKALVTAAMKTLRDVGDSQRDVEMQDEQAQAYIERINKALGH